jgi:hypothetical protein
MNKPDPTETSSPQITNKPPPQPKKLLKKTQDAIRMCQAGIDPETALKATNLKETISPRAITNLKAKCRKYSLTEPSMVAAMSTQVKRILKARARQEAHTKVDKFGKVIEYTDNIYPTDSNILAACAMVADRCEPIINQQNVNVKVTHAVDLTRYLNRDVMLTLDIEQNSQVVDMIECVQSTLDDIPPKIPPNEGVEGEEG